MYNEHLRNRHHCNDAVLKGRRAMHLVTAKTWQNCLHGHRKLNSSCNAQMYIYIAHDQGHAANASDRCCHCNMDQNDVLHRNLDEKDKSAVCAKVLSAAWTFTSQCVTSLKQYLTNAPDKT